MCLPEVLLLKHGPDGGIKGDSIRAHHAHTLRDQVACGLGSHTAVIGEITFLSIVGRCTRLNSPSLRLLCAFCVSAFGRRFSTADRSEDDDSLDALGLSRRVLATHGYREALVHWLRDRGMNADLVGLAHPTDPEGD